VTSTAPAGPATKSPVAGGATTKTSGNGPPKPYDDHNCTALNAAPLGAKGKSSSGTGQESVVIVGVSLEGARVER
jgi:hypothetical protein